jgi:hypothetical protein
VPSQVGQVIDHRVFVAAHQHVHDGVVLDVTDDASRAYQMDFIDTHALGGLKLAPTVNNEMHFMDSKAGNAKVTQSTTEYGYP